MKIKVMNEDNSTIRMFHDPKDVVIRPQENVVELIDPKSQTIEKFQLLEKNLDWLDVPGADCLQVYLELKVDQKGQKESSLR